MWGRGKGKVKGTPTPSQQALEPPPESEPPAVQSVGESAGASQTSVEPPPQYSQPSFGPHVGFDDNVIKVRPGYYDDEPSVLHPTTCCLCCYHHNWRFYRKSCFITAGILLFFGVIRIGANVYLITQSSQYTQNEGLNVIIWLDPWSALVSNRDNQQASSDDEMKVGAGLYGSLLAKLVAEIAPAILLILGARSTSAPMLLIALILQYLRFLWTIVDTLFIFVVGFAVFGAKFDHYKFTIPEAIYIAGFLAFPFEIFALSSNQGMYYIAK